MTTLYVEVEMEYQATPAGPTFIATPTVQVTRFSGSRTYAKPTPSSLLRAMTLALSQKYAQESTAFDIGLSWPISIRPFRLVASISHSL